MMRSNRRFACAAVATLGLLVAACGEESTLPTATDSPCGEPNTTCLELTLAPKDMTYSSAYDARLDKTMHTLSWNVGSEILSGYAPGRHLVIKVNFKPPIQSRYNHPTAGFFFWAGIDAQCYDRHVSLTASVLGTGWWDYWNVITCGGECDTGASSMNVNVAMLPAASKPLTSVLVTFVVPETYTTGPRPDTPVLPGDLDVHIVQMWAQVDGDTGPNPPQWQGTYPPAMTAQDQSAR